MTRTDLINASTGCIRANSAVARRIMTGQQTQHRVLAKGKNNPFRVGEIYWIREPGRIQCPIKHVDSPLWGWSTVRYTDDEGISIRVPEEMRESRWFLESQGIPNGIFKEAARTFVRIKRAWREPVQSITSYDCRAEGIQCSSKDGFMFKYGLADSDGLPGNDDIGWKWSNWGRTPQQAFGKLFNYIYPGAWDRNEDVWACEFELVEVTE